MTQVFRNLLGCAALLAAAATSAGADELDGAALYDDYCAACHAEKGAGTPGLAPPLARPEFWAALGDQAGAYISGVMVDGLSGTLTVDGQMYAGLIMPPQRAFDDAELAAVANYVLSDLSGHEGGVAAGDIAAAREAKTGHAGLRKMRPDS